MDYSATHTIVVVKVKKNSTICMWATYLMGLGKPIGVRLFCGLGKVFRILIEDTFPRSTCFSTPCEDEQVNLKPINNTVAEHDMTSPK